MTKLDWAVIASFVTMIGGAYTFMLFKDSNTNERLTKMEFTVQKHEVLAKACDDCRIVKEEQILLEKQTAKYLTECQKLVEYRKERPPIFGMDVTLPAYLIADYMAQRKHFCIPTQTLHALLYLMQAYALVHYQQPLFRNKIEVRQNIITIPRLNIRTKCVTKDHLGEPLVQFADNIQKAYTMHVVNIIGKAYGTLLLNEQMIKELVINTPPYIKAKSTHSYNALISHADMIDYFSVIWSDKGENK